MNEEKAKEIGYTHNAKLYGVEGFVKIDNDDTFGDGFHWQAKTWFGTIISNFFIWIEVNIGVNELGFPIHLGEKL